MFNMFLVLVQHLAILQNLFPIILYAGCWHGMLRPDVKWESIILNCNYYINSIRDYNFFNNSLKQSAW